MYMRRQDIPPPGGKLGIKKALSKEWALYLFKNLYWITYMGFWLHIYVCALCSYIPHRDQRGHGSLGWSYQRCEPMRCYSQQGLLWPRAATTLLPVGWDPSLKQVSQSMLTSMPLTVSQAKLPSSSAKDWKRWGNCSSNKQLPRRKSRASLSGLINSTSAFSSVPR